MVIAGVDIFDDGGLCQLRDAVNAAGFTQVYYGHSHHYHCGWFGREMRRIAVNDPEARLIFVGYGVGAGNAAQLAAEAQMLGYNVDGLVLLDPIKLPDVNKTFANTPVLIFGSDRWKITGGCPNWEIVRLPDVCHYSIATDPYTVERIIDLLRDAVACVPENAWPVIVMPLIDDPAPVPAVIADIAATPHVPLSNVP
jgi:pimeloyl-ACP methyl ester carboxylesterase